MARRLACLVLCVTAVAIGACGGEDDQESAQQAVRDFVEATNDRDGERLCGELLTEEFKQKATGATGERVDDVCKQQLELTEGFELRLVSIGRTAVDGDRATVRATLDTDGVEAPRVFVLEKEDGDWKLAAGRGG